jgi:predicted RNA-binding Zn-ribbon protein involved in translation (DUF1610 family)
VSVPLLHRVTDWHCPNCGATDQTREAKPHTRMHICPKLHGLTTPMVQVGVKANVTARLREDYVGTEKVQTAPFDGRPYMSIVTERDDGQDAVVFAPTATGDAHAR